MIISEDTTVQIQLAVLQAEVQRCITMREGMIAHNQCNEAGRYTEEGFISIQNELAIIGDRIQELLRG